MSLEDRRKKEGINIHLKELKDMQSKSQSANPLEPDPRVIQPCAVHSEPWWRSIGFNTVSSAVPAGNTSNLSSPDGPNGSLSNDDQSLSNGGVNEDDDDASKESQATASSQSGTFMYTKLIEG